jgi:hypothetical protein
MNRQKLLALISSIGLIATVACSDIVAPRNDDPAPCPQTGGSDCQPH